MAAEGEEMSEKMYCPIKTAGALASGKYFDHGEGDTYQEATECDRENCTVAITETHYRPDVAAGQIPYKIFIRCGFKAPPPEVK